MLSLKSIGQINMSKLTKEGANRYGRTDGPNNPALKIFVIALHIHNYICN